MEITGGSYVVSIPVYEGPMDLLLHFFRNDGKRKKVRRRIPAVSWNVRWKNSSG